MKKIRTFKGIYPLIALFGMALLFAAACKKSKNNPDPKPEPVVVNVPDPILAAQIRLRLKLSSSDAINTENILALDSLDLDGEENEEFIELSDLTGLEAAANLVYLHVGATSITTLTPIKDLKKVKYLRLNDTGVSDLSPIANYTTLTYFNINTVTTITDISPLGKNTGMKEIILRSVPFGNAGMATIAKFTGLYRINMRGTGVTDISVLAELMSNGALLDTTPDAAENGGADLDLRGLDGIDCSLIDPYKDQITNIEGC